MPSKRQFQSSILITGDANGGIKAFKLTRQEAQRFNASVGKSSLVTKEWAKTAKGAGVQSGFLARNFKELAGAAGVFSAGLAVRELARASDTYATMSARIKLVTNTQEEFNFAQKELFEIAQETSQGLSETNKLYFRLSRSLTRINAPQEKVLALTKGINQALIIQGATAQESASTLLQLSQAFASGRLAGEEFRAVSENGSIILDKLAESLGVARGSLKQMAADGLLTTEVMYNALLPALEDINTEAQKMPQTLARSVTEIKNSFLQIVGSTDAALGASKGLAIGLEALAKNLGSIITLVAILAGAKGIGLLVGSLTTVIATAKRFGVGLVVLNAQMAASEARTAALSRATMLLGGPAGVFVAAATAAGFLFTKIIDLVDAQKQLDAESALTAARNSIKGVGNDEVSLIDELIGRKEVNDAKVEQYILTLNKVITSNQRLKEQIEAPFLRSNIAFDDAAKEQIKNYNDSIEAATAALEKAQTRLAGVTVEASFFQKELESINGKISPLVALQNAHNKKLEEYRKELKKTGDEKGFEKALKALDKLHIKNIAALKTSTKEVKKLATAEEKLAKIANDLLREMDPLTAVTQDFNAQMSELAELFEITKDVETYQKAVDLLKKSFDEQTKSLKKNISETKEYEDLLEDLARDTVDYAAEQILQLKISVEEATAKFGEQSPIVQELVDQLARLSQEYANVSESASSVPSADGLFGKGGDSFQDLLGSAFDGASNSEGFGSFFSAIGDGFSAAAEGGAESLSNALSSAGDFASFALSEYQNNDSGLRALTNVAAQIPGKIGAIAQAVQRLDSFVGGRLLGTNYEVQDSSRNINFGSGGFSGSNSVRETRERSLFRGTRTRITESDLDQSLVDQLDQFFDAITQAMATAARSLGLGSVPDLIAGSFAEEFDKEGNLVSSISSVLGRTYAEGIEQFQQRVLAENLLAVLGQSVGGVEVTRRIASGGSSPSINIGDPSDRLGIADGGGGGVGATFTEITVMVSEVESIAERWRHSAEELLEGAQFLLVAQQTFVDGNQLLGEGSTLTQLTDFVEELNHAGESLIDTLIRLDVSADNLTDGLNLMGVSLDLGREEFVRFATDITDAAGGVERASQLWGDFFSTFFSQEEVLQAQLNVATDNASAEFADIGLSSTIAPDEFRRLFEEALPTLSAESTVQWLEAAQALGVVIDVQTQLNDILGEAAEAERERVDSLAEFMRGITTALTDLDQTEFQRAVTALNKEMAGLRNTAISLGASQAELSQIEELAIRRLQGLISDLKASAQSLVGQLFGGGLDDVNSRIAELQASESSGINSVQSELKARYDEEVRSIQRVRDFLKGLQLDQELSVLTPAERLAEAERQYNETLAAAQGGDLEALARLASDSQNFLQESRDFYASSGAYTDIFDAVNDALSDLDVTSSDPGSGGTGDTSGISAELQALYDERDRILAEQEAARREALGLQLAEHIGDLAEALGIPIGEVASQLGISIGELASAVGINVGELTSGLVLQLDSFGNTLGVDLGEIATELGVSTADLARALGVDLGNLSTIGAELAGLSADLGIDLGELAGALGISTDALATSLGIDLTNANGLLLGQLTAVSTALGIDLGSLSTALGADLTVVDGAITRIGADFFTVSSTIGDKFDDLDRSILAVDTGFGTVNTALGGISTNIGGVSAATGSLSRDLGLSLSPIATQMGGINTSAGGLITAIGGVDETLGLQLGAINTGSTNSAEHLQRIANGLVSADGSAASVNISAPIKVVTDTAITAALARIGKAAEDTKDAVGDNITAVEATTEAVGFVKKAVEDTTEAIDGGGGSGGLFPQAQF